MTSIQFVLRKNTAKGTLIPEKIQNKNSTVEFPPIKDTIQYIWNLSNLYNITQVKFV